MQPRMKSPAQLLPGVMQSIRHLSSSAANNDVPASTIGLIELRASQINGCSVCVDIHARFLKEAGETDERLFAVAAWSDAPYFTNPERAALALAEAVTRLSDRPDPVPDEIWNEAARHYNERQLAALLIAISAINVWNRLNVATRQVAGEWLKSPEAQSWLASQHASG